jgi:hypothetical protein
MAGRPKGSLSRRNRTVFEICSELKFDPSRELIKLRNETNTVIDKDGNPHEVGVSHELKEKIYNDLLPYIYPKLSALQVSTDPDRPLIINIVQFKGSQCQS